VRFFLYGLVALVVLVIAAVLIGPSFVDWNAHKTRLAAEVRAATGRDLTIDGDMHLAILPAPALSAIDVRFANIPGGTEPFMAEVRELRIRIALLPLIQGRIQVESVSLVAPRILLETLADGRHNWSLGSAAKVGEPGAAAAESSGDVLPGQIQLDSFTISDGTLIYRDASDGREERVERLDAEIVAESLSGPMTSRGNAVVHGIETEFDLAAGRLVMAGATPFNLTLRLPAAAAEAQFAGSVSLHPDTLRFRGHFEGQGSSLASAVRALSGGRLDGWPALTHQSFALQSDLSGDLASATGSDVRLRLGEAAMSGDATINFEPRLDATLSLKATLIDLDQLLASGGSGEGTLSEPASPASGAPADAVAERPASLPSDISARLEVAVEGLIYRGQAMRQLRFDASLDDGKIVIGQAMALLPGGSDLSLTGLVSPGDSGLRFTGRVESVSDNFRGLAAWMGADLAAVPADRLRRMSFASQIEASRQQVDLKDIDLRVDLTRVTGGIVAAMRQRIGLGIGLAMDKLNLDAYLPAHAVEETQGAVAEPVGSAAVEGRAGPGLLALLERFDANLDFRIGKLIYRGGAAKDLRLDGTLQNGALTLRQASIGALPGARAAYSGEIRDFASAAWFDGELEIEVFDPPRLARAFHLDAEPLTRLKRFSLRSGLKGSGEKLQIDAAFSTLGGRLGLIGTIWPTAEPAVFDVAMTAQHPDLPGLIRALGGATGLKPDFGGLDLTGQVVGTPLDFNVGDLAGKLGSIDLSGRFSAELAGSKPFVRATLATGDLPLALLLAPAAGRKKAQAGAQAQGRGTRNAEPRWSREALDLAHWNALDGELALTVRRLKLDRTDLEDIALTAKLYDGVLDVERLTASLYDGALQMSGQIVAKESLEAGFTLTAAEVNLGKLLRAQADFKRVSGPISLNAELTTSGSSEAELISALGGKGDFSGTLQVKVNGKERPSGLALELLGDKVWEIRNLADATTTLLSNFAGAPAGLAGTFTLDRGVLVTDDARIDGTAAHALTRARADFPAWRLDSQTDVFQAPDPDTPYLTANLKGPLDAPDVRLGGLPFKNPELAPGSGQNDQPDEELAPVVPEKRKTQDVLKGLLKGLRG